MSPKNNLWRIQGVKKVSHERYRVFRKVTIAEKLLSCLSDQMPILTGLLDLANLMEMTSGMDST